VHHGISEDQAGQGRRFLSMMQAPGGAGIGRCGTPWIRPRPRWYCSGRQDQGTPNQYRTLSSKRVTALDLAACKGQHQQSGPVGDTCGPPTQVA
jgi:hypothetical protein